MKIDFPREKWELLRDSIADVSCWHMGFNAAKGNDSYHAPPQLRDLEDLAKEIQIKIKDDIKVQEEPKR